VFPSDNQLETFVFCESTQVKNNLFAPVGIKTDFTSKDDAVICYIKLKNVSDRLSVSWRWYSPLNLLKRNSGELILNPNNKFIETATASDSLVLNTTNEDEQGLWTVTFYINGILIMKRYFTISGLY
jgi:hypothetical protein